MPFLISKIIENKAYFEKNEAYHIHKVLRKKEGDSLVGFDEDFHYKLKINGIEDDSIECIILEKIDKNAELSKNVILCIALSKKNKFEFLLEKSVELGVKEIWCFPSAYSVVKIKDIEKKQDRYEKIILSAVKQCERTHIPEIKIYDSFEEILLCLPKENAQQIFLHPYNSSEKISEIPLKKDNIFVFIGPEGGFSPKEVDIARDSGFQFAHLGRRILRLETAGVLTLGAVMLNLD